MRRQGFSFRLSRYPCCVLVYTHAALPPPSLLLQLAKRIYDHEEQAGVSYRIRPALILSEHVEVRQATREPGLHCEY